MPTAHRSSVWLAGVDGCPAGWVRVARNPASGEVRVDVVEEVGALLTLAPRPALVAIDMPIGLPDAGVRACDREARALLGPRRSSVFSAPIRAALEAKGYEDACHIGRATDGRALSIQSWHLVPKIRALDALLAHEPAARAIFHEAHPELCFREWNGGQPMPEPKRKEAGRHARAALAEDWLGAALLADARARWPRVRVADDDLLDAVATLWSAHRIHAGEARSVPADPPQDATGLPMRILY